MNTRQAKDGETLKNLRQEVYTVKFSSKGLPQIYSKFQEDPGIINSMWYQETIKLIGEDGLQVVPPPF